MKVECDIEDFLSILKTFEDQGVRIVSLDIDNELEGLKMTPIDNPYLHPKIVGKQRFM